MSNKTRFSFLQKNNAKDQAMQAAYKKLFLDENNKLKPEAEVVLNDMANICGFYSSLETTNENQIKIDLGKRIAYSKVLERLNFNYFRKYEQIQQNYEESEM